MRNSKGLNHEVQCMALDLIQQPEYFNRKLVIPPSEYLGSIDQGSLLVSWECYKSKRPAPWQNLLPQAIIVMDVECYLINFLLFIWSITRSL